MDLEVEEKTQISNGVKNKSDPNMDDQKTDSSVEDDIIDKKETDVAHNDDHCDEVNGIDGDLNNHKSDNLGSGDIEDTTGSQDEGNGFSDELKIASKSSEISPAPIKKRRRSKAFNTSLGDSPEGTSRYGRARRPKHDDEQFLPTDAVLGKTLRKTRQSLHDSSNPHTEAQPSVTSTDLNGSVDEALATEDEPVESTDSTQDLKTPAEIVGEADGVEEEITTEYEPGDLIWGRLGHHPFWPCVVINDPVDSIYYKKTGRGRGLSYHVLFYGDNGMRSWVASSMILRFLGMQDFQMKVAAITAEVKKKDPKLFSGFFVKSNTRAKWEAAVREAEEVMPMTRDERLDAFLSTMPQRKGKKSKVADDDNDTDATVEGTEGESGDSPLSMKKKKKTLGKTDLSPTEKKKRGRPRKSDILSTSTQVEQDTHELAVKTASGAGRPRKRKLLTDIDSKEGDDDSDSKGVERKRKRRKKKDKKSIEELAFSLFSENHLDRVQNDHPGISDEEIKKYLHLLWDRKDEDEKTEFMRMVTTEDKSEEESASEEEDDGPSNAANEEVASVDSGKETNEDETSVTSKKKINLFRGFKMERVCQNCEKPGNTVKCRGPCAGVFHVECARGADNSVGQFLMIEEVEEKPKKRGRKKKEAAAAETLPTVKKEISKSKAGARHKKIYADEETDSDLDYADEGPSLDMNDEEAIMRMILGETAELPKVSMVSQEESEEDDEEDDVEDQTELGGQLASSVTADFRCGDCAVLRTPLCYVCGQATVPTGEDSVRVRCSLAYCGKHYHIECLKVLWPQASYTTNKSAIQNLTCPQHVCHTCVSDNPRDSKGRFSNEKLVRCVRCPTSYHYGNYCVPAGSKILTANQIICPRHYEPPKKGTHHINASWCFICSIGGSLICCDLCPSSFHADCLKIKPPAGSYICEDCETGRYPLYSEVLWVKLGSYRWWPALSLFPSEVPEKMNSRPHTLGEFAVRFLGTNDHYWIERGRCFVYHEGDCVGEKKANSKMDNSYQQGVLQANELHKAHKEIRSKIQSQNKTGNMKPPQYVKIKTNKAIGSVKMIEIDTSNISPCECDPNADHPCSPDTECLNRILMVECDPNTCPAGEKCENQYFEKRIYPSLTPYCTDGRGWGLQTLEDIKKGSFVIEYVGEVIDDEEYQRRLLKKHEEKDENYYFLTIDSTRIIDAGPKGNVSRFMNHSCQPNCETQKWTVMGDTRVGLFTLYDVPAGTELTFNYNLESKGNEKKPCMCGAAVCSGFIGAKKNKVLPTDAKELSSTGKKKRRKPRVRNLIEDICLLCDADKEVGVLISCINKECASRYHLTCVGLASTPLGKWLCPRHHCNVCQKRTQQWCSYCTESYCPVHIGENLVNDPLHGDICEAHQKNPLSKDHLKTKRDEARKLKEEEKKKIEEEKRKQYEEERAQRRSRREQITNEEEAAKVKKSHSDMEDTASDGSVGGEDKLVIVSKTESMEVASVVEAAPSDSMDGYHPSKKSRVSSKEEKESNSSKRTPKSQDVSHSKGQPNSSRRGRKKKLSLDISSSPLSLKSKKVELKEELIQRIEDDIKEIEELSKSNMCEESQISSSVFDDSCKDDIPDADPALDKFIQAPAPIDDESLLQTPELKKKKKRNSPKSDRVLSNEASPSSVTKRRRKPPVHNMDYINSQSLNLKRPYLELTPDRSEKMGTIKKLIPKKSKDTNFDKVGLMDELEDIATGFASDDGQESPKVHFKKGGVKTKRPNMGIVRSHTADSTTNEIFDYQGVKKTVQHTSPKTLKSPLSPIERLPLGSPEKLTASKILAMQRAKGLKVMPPNRRLSLAREQAQGARSGDDMCGKVERSGKGLKVLKGRRFSGETNTSDSRTENLHGEVLQSGVAKKARPVLSKVEDNGVSVDEEEDKVLETSTLPSPKQPQTHPMQSPPSKKIKPSPKNSSAIGVCSLWNQDILNIMK